MDITNAAIFEVLAERRPLNARGQGNQAQTQIQTQIQIQIQNGAPAAGSRRRPFPWVGTVAPFLSSRAQETLGVSATLLAILVAALI